MLPTLGPITRRIRCYHFCVVLTSALILVQTAKIGLAEEEYTPAIKLLPDTVAGLVRVPNVPAFCKAFDTTNVGQLLDDPAMQPFIKVQRDRAKSYLQSLGNRIGIKLEDVSAIGSGETVLAWLPFENDSRRPYALIAIADVRGREAQSAQTLEKIDTDLKDGGWSRSDVSHRDQQIRVYNHQPKPGQLKIEQIAITLSKTRIVASDRDTVVMDFLDAVAGQPKGKPIAGYADFKSVLSRSAQLIREPAEKDGGAIGFEWFAKPFQMGRIVRQSLSIDRGNQVDLLKLLEGQGFDAIRAAGGITVIGGKKYDALHKGFILAPPTTQLPSRYEKAARMLQFENKDLGVIPTWVDENAAAVSRLNLKMEEAFWATESLVNEILKDDLFREIINGIRDDQSGPQIDIVKDLLPNLDDHVLIISDNVLPASVTSERMLVAIRVKDAGVISKILSKAMEGEPDATLMEGPGGVDIWKIQRSEDAEEDFGEDLFEDFDVEEDEDAGGAGPLLNQGSLAVSSDGSGSAYFLFSSHPELLASTIQRMQQGPKTGWKDLDVTKQVKDAMLELGGQNVSFSRLVQTKRSLRIKYELLRQGKLQESQSLGASLLRRLVADEEGETPKPIDAAKLPPVEEVEKHFPNGGGFLETVDDGWTVTGFFLN